MRQTSEWYDSYAYLTAAKILITHIIESKEKYSTFIYLFIYCVNRTKVHEK